MDSIKSKMLTLSQATSDATARALIYDEELRQNNDLADKFEEQVRHFIIVKVLLTSIIHCYTYILINKSTLYFVLYFNPFNFAKHFGD